MRNRWLMGSPVTAVRLRGAKTHFKRTNTKDCRACFWSLPWSSNHLYKVGNFISIFANNDDMLHSLQPSLELFVPSSLAYFCNCSSITLVYTISSSHTQVSWEPSEYFKLSFGSCLPLYAINYFQAEVPVPV